jgi:hypothetical protein
MREPNRKAPAVQQLLSENDRNLVSYSEILVSVNNQILRILSDEASQRS